MSRTEITIDDATFGSPRGLTKAGLAEVERIFSKHEGKPQKEIAQAIVDAARSKSSVLHESFQWDDRKAGELHRLEVARRFIISIDVVFVDGPEKPSRAHVGFVGEDGCRSMYGLRRVLSNADLTKAMLERAREDLLAWQRRYDHLKEVARFGSTIRKMAKGLRK